ncbi:AbrB/MazE/SpoVT family DNA-binding domain-containing protein [Bacillota bacterium Meth-B3]|nr:AbrB/MazE/SpoVT family DNA-binding domain-containing protein [Christensenellaceae bacterium]MEA5066711.1 AbrB/MazE/SpoVT family DNA-binding domain-containing protein [Eubacteriales bacterium]
MKSKAKNGRFMSSIKVGPKGQIVIPKEVRAMFDISPGDTLLLLADRERGIALERYGVFAKISDAIFAGKAKEIYPDQSEEDLLLFANAVKEAGDGK